MAIAYKVIDAKDIELATGEEHDFALDVLLGLSKEQKSIPPKYFYDDRGSELFEEITQLSEYYPTSCESEILERHRGEISALIGDRPFNIVELGAGDGHKTEIILRQLRDDGRSFQYVPIDISEGAMRSLTTRLADGKPPMRIQGIVGDYFHGLIWHSFNHSDRNLALFLGSNIGNMDGHEARAFLRSLWNYLEKDDLLLIGFDLKKSTDVLLPAYSDARGVTAEFNLNLLDRMNRELGANFDRGKFKHYAMYDAVSGGMRSYLISTEEQTVTIEAVRTRFQFAAYEAIHTEYSYKFLDTDIRDLAAISGFEIVDQFYDRQKYFTDSVWRVVKTGEVNQ
jgi:dimethylhistidine N-methyltransferase